MQLVEGNPPRADSYLIKPKWFTACGGSDVQTIRGHSRSGCGQQPDFYRLKDTEHSRQNGGGGGYALRAIEGRTYITINEKLLLGTGARCVPVFFCQNSGFSR